jgi:hypothetical protein
MQIKSLKQKFQRLSRPWKIATYCVLTVFAVFVLVFGGKNAIAYHEYTVAQSQIRKAESLAQRSEQKAAENPGYFPGKPPTTVNMSLDKSPHYYQNSQ